VPGLRPAFDEVNECGPAWLVCFAFMTDRTYQYRLFLTVAHTLPLWTA
jgi:hypothetical protein